MRGRSAIVSRGLTPSKQFHRCPLRLQHLSNFLARALSSVPLLSALDAQIPLEHYIGNFLLEVPAPSPGRVEVGSFLLSPSPLRACTTSFRRWSIFDECSLNSVYPNLVFEKFKIWIHIWGFKKRALLCNKRLRTGLASHTLMPFVLLRF